MVIPILLYLQTLLFRNVLEPKPFKRLDQTDTLTQYGETCGQFLAYCILVAQNVFPQLPICPLPSLAKELLLKLSSQLQDNQSISNSLITACLSSLFIHTIPYDLPDTSFHALQFFLLRMIKEDGSYHPHQILTGIISQIQYCVRMAFLNLYLGIGSSHELCLSICNQCLDGDREHIWSYLTECGKNTPFWGF